MRVLILAATLATSLHNPTPPMRHTFSDYHKDDKATLCVSLAQLGIQAKDHPTKAKMRAFLEHCYLATLPRA